MAAHRYGADQPPATPESARSRAPDRRILFGRLRPGQGMSLISKYLRRITKKRSAEERWNERWADPSFHPEPLLAEASHHFILAGYAHVLKPGGVLLDAGCGDG